MPAAIRHYHGLIACTISVFYLAAALKFTAATTGTSPMLSENTN